MLLHQPDELHYSGSHSSKMLISNTNNIINLPRDSVKLTPPEELCVKSEHHSFKKFIPSSHQSERNQRTATKYLTPRSCNDSVQLKPTVSRHVMHTSIIHNDVIIPIQATNNTSNRHSQPKSRDIIQRTFRRSNDIGNKKLLGNEHARNGHSYLQKAIHPVGWGEKSTKKKKEKLKENFLHHGYTFNDHISSYNSKVGYFNLISVIYLPCITMILSKINILKVKVCYLQGFV